MEKSTLVEKVKKKAEGFEQSGDIIAALSNYLILYGVLETFPPPSSKDELENLQQTKIAPLVQLVNQLKKIAEFQPPAERTSVTSSSAPPSTEEEETKGCPEPTKDLLKYNFDKLVGLEDEKIAILEGFVYPFLYPLLFIRNKAILMYGPPGTGKTELAKAASSELFNRGIDVAVFSAGGAELKSKWSGETEKSIARYFSCAEQRAKDKIIKGEAQRAVSIIFMDEFDAIAGKRDSEDKTMVHSVNALISRMEGIDSYPNVIILAATNKPWNLDSAIDRRFGLKLLVDLPNDKTRKEKIIQMLKSRVFQDLTKGATFPDKDLFSMLSTYGSGFQEKDVDTIVEWTGFRKDAEGQIEKDQLPKQFLGNRTLYDKAKTRFGYSLSDLTKMMEKAFNISAQRILTSPLTKTEIKFPNGTTVQRWVPVKNKTENSKYLRIEGLPPEKYIPKEEMELVESFDFQLNDFEIALSLYPSTIVPHEYVTNVLYSRQALKI